MTREHWEAHIVSEELWQRDQLAWKGTCANALSSGVTLLEYIAARIAWHRGIR